MELRLKADGEWRSLGVPPAERGVDAKLVTLTPSGLLFVSDETHMGTRTMHMADLSSSDGLKWIEVGRTKALLTGAAVGDGFVDVGFQENKGGRVEVSVWRYWDPQP
ncbi:MAG TPA: hypothetical protein VN033_07985 [Vulgatibacter sp.]|nr:hypothetical protein [Vulgatibacter sp.]